MTIMQTRIDPFALAFECLNPLDSWQAAARWNAMALEWMTRGWRQWLELATMWPALESPAAAMNEVARSIDAIDVPATFIAPGAAEAEAGPASLAAPAGTQKARNARALEEAPQARGRTGEGARTRAKSRKRSERPVAKGASSRPAGKRPARTRG